jgi:hypothetical protein
MSVLRIHTVHMGAPHMRASAIARQASSTLLSAGRFFTRHSYAVGAVLTGASFIAGVGEVGATYALANAGAATAATHADLTRAAAITATVLVTGVGCCWHSSAREVTELKRQQSERALGQ